MLLSCSDKKLFSKKNEIFYLDCPKSLILAPGSKLNINNSIISLSNDYNISCYYVENQPSQAVFEIDYNIKLEKVDLDEKIHVFDFWFFITNKEETSKLYEFKFEKSIQFNLIDDDINSLYAYQDKIIINRNVYEEGSKIFLSLN